MNDLSPDRVPDPDTPPVLGRWRNLYALVLGGLVLWIALFWLFERAFS